MIRSVRVFIALNRNSGNVSNTDICVDQEFKRTTLLGGTNPYG